MTDTKSYNDAIQFAAPDSSARTSNGKSSAFYIHKDVDVIKNIVGCNLKSFIGFRRKVSILYFQIFLTSVGPCNRT